MHQNVTVNRRVLCSVTTSSQKVLEKLSRKDKRRAERSGHDADIEWLLVNGFEELLEAELEAGALPL